MLDLTQKTFIATALLLSMSVSASAKSTTIGNITLDVPAAFKASASSRGIEAATPDEEVYTWFEVYKGDENAKLQAEHEKYWKENDVVLHDDPQTTETKVGDVKVSTLFFPKATWQGKPTILRYVKIGPVGNGTMVLMTVWASPEGINEHGKEVEQMLDTLHVKVAQ